MKPEREIFLDALRAIAIAGVLFYHVGMMFVSWGWHISNNETSSGLEALMDVMHQVRMPLLMVIAGAVAMYSLQRRAVGGFLRERSQRLLLPLVLGMFLIVPPQVYWERVFDGEWQGGYWQFYVERVLQFDAYPQGDFSWHHLWFIAYLWVFSLLAAPLLKRWQHVQTRSAGWHLLAIAVLTGACEAVLLPHFPETHGLWGDWNTLLWYFLWFLAGAWLTRVPDAFVWLAAQRHRLLGLVAVQIVVAVLVKPYWWHDGFDAFYAALFTWAFALMCFGYGKQHLQRRSALLDWARDAGYPFYILHQTVIVGVGMWVLPQPWSLWGKFAVSLLATVLITTLIYELARRVPLLRPVLGLPLRQTRAAPVAVVPSRPAPVAAD